MTSKSQKTRFHQVAALPWRIDDDGELRVVLVTSRERGRWILPKGWPIRGLDDADAAATEAMEEAGLVGRVARKAFGRFAYVKRFPGRAETVTVDVYPLRVERQLELWPEKGQREIRWYTPGEAAANAGDKGVAELVLRFATGARQAAPAD
jgi:8-oxo-dGTP pyrophosphatase MutT (NUDIX family)